jgi:phenylpropionate dioxygenase-like ring-hydroxylating dioxygenase large terminal subunit
MNIEDLRSLIEPERVHRRVYTDPAIFELEMERVFGRTWLYVAHESQLRNSGDFIRAHLANREVLVTRSEDGRIHVLDNRCAHRGAVLCTAPQGSRRNFLCPYHAWSFHLDGRLNAVPHPQSYPESFSLTDPENQLGCAPRVDSYRGFVFASLAAEGPSLLEHLGSMTAAFDNLIDRAPGGEVELADSSFSIEYRGNWKMHHENANDTVHPGFVHESSVGVARADRAAPTDFDNDQTREMLLGNGFGPRDWETIALVGLPAGHTYMTGFYRNGVLAPEQSDPVRDEYRAALTARHGAQRAAEILALDRFNNLVYPNLNINAQYHQLRIVQPVAVDRTIVHAHCFRLKGAPEEIFHRAIRFLSNIGSPASMIFGDDVEIFTRCQDGLTHGGAEWVNAARGFGRDETGNDGELRGTASELPNRIQFAAWLRLMTEGAS